MLQRIMSLVLALALAACSSRVTTFVRAVEWSPKGTLLVTTCTLEEDGFTKGNAVDPETCRTTERPHP